MNKSETFNKAHSVAKANKYGIGTYAERFSSELSSIYLRRRIIKRKQATKLAEEKANQERLAKWSANEAAKPKVCPIEEQYLHGLTHTSKLWAVV